MFRRLDGEWTDIEFHIIRGARAIHILQEVQQFVSEASASDNRCAPETLQFMSMMNEISEQSAEECTREAPTVRSSPPSS